MAPAVSCKPEIEPAVETIIALPERYGGWIHYRDAARVIMRVPAQHLKTVMATVSELGIVEAKTLRADDVTAEFTDLEARIKILEETEAHLLKLLAKAKTVEDSLHVRRALDQVSMELELARGRMRALSESIAFSTLTIDLTQRGPEVETPTSNDPFGWVDDLGTEATEFR